MAFKGFREDVRNVFLEERFQIESLKYSCLNYRLIAWTKISTSLT